MQDDIGYSSIFPTSGAGFGGPRGSTGPTGAAQPIPGATGAIGSDSTYIKSVNVNESGVIEVVSSDDVISISGNLIGPTGIYAGVTALSVGGGIPFIRGVCGGITLDFYNIRTAGLLGVTYTQDGSLKITINENSEAGGISASTEANRIVYIKQNTHIMSTDLIPQTSTNSNRIGSVNYSYINFGGETAGRNIVADIRETILSVGPIKIGEKIVTLDNFYDHGGTEGITLDVSRATVFQVTTPIGIKAFKHDPIPEGQIMSVTMIVHDEDVWNFPSDVVFDQNSSPVFYPGTNILHLWKSSDSSIWRANFSARGFGVSEINDPGSRGSCCYYDADGTRNCLEYTTQTYCNEKNGTYAPFTSCGNNPCVTNDGTDEYNGVCCSEGRCIPNIDFNLCQAINGYFIDGITCGQYGLYPDDNASNLSTEENISGLCYNKCKEPSICCKNGECLGNITQEHCEQILGGKIVAASNCVEASCCDHVNAPGACCTIDGDNYSCTQVNTPFECISSGGFYMGRNTSCETVNCSCDINEVSTCYRCEQGPNGCNCVPETITNGTCESYGYYDTPTDCSNNCLQKTCYKCNGSVCEQITSCGTCPTGYIEGSCVEDITCQTKTCYKACENCQCDSQIIPANEQCPDGYENSSCDCDTSVCDRQIACFWCFPQINSNITNSSPLSGTSWGAFAARHMQAPYRAVAFLNSETLTKLNNYTNQSEPLSITLPSPDGSTTRAVNILTQQYTENSFTYEIPYFVETLTSNTNINVANLPTAPATIHSNPLSVTGSYRCYYIGSYQHSTANPIENRTRCLNAFGYQNVNQQKCKLCDKIEEINYQLLPTPANPEGIYNITSVEPYSRVINDYSAYAPFPPLWGRITQAWETQYCGLGLYFRETLNLRLMSDQRILEMCHSARTGELKGFMHKLMQKFKSGYQGKNEILNDMVSGMNSGLGNTEYVGPHVNTVFSSFPSSHFIKYDPYLLSTVIPTTYGSPLQYAYHKSSNTNDLILHVSCARDGSAEWTNWNNDNTIDPEDPGTVFESNNWWQRLRGWYLPWYNERIGAYGESLANIDYDNWSTETKLKVLSYYYPLQDGSPILDENTEGTIDQLTGELFFYKPEDQEFGPIQGGATLIVIPPPNPNGTPTEDYGTTATRNVAINGVSKGLPRGIFGRNLRYNLDKYRTATVFYHEENGVLVQTMPFVPLGDKHVSVPVLYINGWFDSSAECTTSWGPQCIGQGGPCSSAPPCTASPGCFGCPGTGGGNGSNWFANVGLIGTSYDFTSTETAPLVQNPINNNKTKTVKIADGICVNMLCPECDLYESC
jgi:hypothetical protein